MGGFSAFWYMIWSSLTQYSLPSIDTAFCPDCLYPQGGSILGFLSRPCIYSSMLDSSTQSIMDLSFLQST